MPFAEILWGVGLKPVMPLNVAGIRILPPMSDPKAIGTHLAATMPASPLLEPPHDLARS